MNRDQLIRKIFPDIPTAYTQRDTMLYALGVGACADPLDAAALRFVFEKYLQALPSMSCVLAHPGSWVTAPELEINWVKLLHAEQHFQLFKPLPSEGKVTGKFRVRGVVDKGIESGALLSFEKTLHDAEGDVLGTVHSTYFLRADGGCGSWGEPPAALPLVPSSEPSGCIEAATLPIAALVYRLSGDYNPLHADPAVARKAGFDKPILQGLCAYGVVCQSLIRGLCDFDASRLRAMGARFTKPVYPGETLRTEWWTGPEGQVQFRCWSVERALLVLDRGVATILPA